MMTVQRMAPSISMCIRPLPLGSAIPLATGHQKKQKVNTSSLSLRVNPLGRDEILLGKEKEAFFLLENELSPLWGGFLVQEGLLGVQEIPGYCQSALDKQTNTPILTQIIAQKGVNEKYWSKGETFH